MAVDLTFAEETVARLGRRPEALIPILQALQEHYGYLPEEALRRVAETTDIPPAALSGVASFYDQFRHAPVGKHIVHVCTGTACHVSGAEQTEAALRRHLNIPEGQNTDAQRLFTVERVACLGCCTLAPVLRIDRAVYGHVTPDRVAAVVNDFLELHAGGSADLGTEQLTADDAPQPAINVGLGSCCMAKGSDRLFAALREAVAESGVAVRVKRVGCVGMCHRTPLVEVRLPGQPGQFYSAVTPAEARQLVHRHFPPPGRWQRVSRAWLTAVDRLLIGEPPPRVERHALHKRDPAVNAFLGKQVHIATEHFGQLDPLNLQEYLAHGGFQALLKCLAVPASQVAPAGSHGDHDSGRPGNGGGAASFPPAPAPQGCRLPAESAGASGPEARSRAGKPEASATGATLLPERIIAAIEQSGLRGRGGAGFPTGQKWRVVARQPGALKYVICNGDEGDPGAFMDRMILESFPFRVIEGLAIAAVAVGAHEGIFYIRHEYPLAVRRVRAAIAQLEQRGWLGTRLLGKDYELKLSVFEGAGAFVCGEETALIASIEGRRGMPRLRPPFPAEAGLWGQPTLINNVETLAVVPWIIRHGPEQFAALGTAQSKGTKVFALAGKVRRGGLIEIPMGTTIREIVEDIGGGVGEGRRFKAVQIGGPSGGCVPARLADTPVDFESLRAVGAIMGSGGLVVLDDSTCMVDIARYFLQFTQNQSCGKCTFCRIGTKRMLDILDRLCAGKATRANLEELERLAAQVSAGSLCGLGKTAPNPVLTTLRYFRDEYEAHLQGRCPARKCTALIHYTINADCTGCTLCSQHCPVNAIPMTPYARHVIDDAKCTRCDTCRQVCPHGAVEVT